MCPKKGINPNQSYCGDGIGTINPTLVKGLGILRGWKCPVLNFCMFRKPTKHSWPLVKAPFLHQAILQELCYENCHFGLAGKGTVVEVSLRSLEDETQDSSQVSRIFGTSF